MSCATHEDVAMLALCGEAGPEELASFERHLAECTECREVHDSRSEVFAAGRVVFRPVVPPARAVARILAVAERRGKEPRCAGRPLVRLVSTVAAGTAFATLCLAFASSLPAPAGVQVAAGDAGPAAEIAASPEPAEAEIDRRVEEIGLGIAGLREDLARHDAASIDAGTARVSARLDELRTELALDEF